MSLQQMNETYMYGRVKMDQLLFNKITDTMIITSYVYILYNV